MSKKLLSKPSNKDGEAVCQKCGTSFVFDTAKPMPQRCGMLACYDPTPDEWAGIRRMAEARQAAGRQPGPRDREALS